MAAPRKPRQPRALATVDAIVEAGLILLATEGPAATTTRRIAETAGVGVGSIYEYFADREAVHEAMFQRIVADAAATIRPLIPTLVRMPIRAAVYQLIASVRELLLRNEQRYLHCVRHALNLARVSSLRPLQKVLNELLLQYLMQHPELAQARNLSTMSYIFINGGTFTVIRHLTESDPALSFDELANGLADMVSFVIAGNLQPLAL